MIPFVSVIKEKALLLLSILLLLTILVLGGMAWWFHRSRESLRAELKEDEINTLKLQAQIAADAAAITRQNTEIRGWQAAMAVVAKEAENTRRLQEAKLESSQKEIDRLRNLPLPEDPAEFRKITDPLLIEMASKWETKR